MDGLGLFARGRWGDEIAMAFHGNDAGRASGRVSVLALMFIMYLYVYYICISPHVRHTRYLNVNEDSSCL